MKIEPFEISVSKYVSTIFSLYIRKYWWLYFSPVAICLALTTININFIYVALCVCFIIIPMALTFVYFAYCLTPDVRFSIMPKVLSQCKDGLMLKFENKDVLLRYDEIKNIRYDKDCLLLKLRSNRYSFFMIPYDVFESSIEIQDFCTRLNTNITTA